MTAPDPMPTHGASKLVLRSLVHTGFCRPDAALVEIIASTDVTRLSELVGRMYTMNASLRAFGPGALPVAGVVTTAKCPPGDNLGLVKALTLVEAGDVLVVDAQGFANWCLGGFQLLRHTREQRGLAGLVVNGAYRDVAEAQQAGFPIYATAVAPYSGPKAGPCEVNVPVCCGGVVVHAGDVISASAEGIVVVPQRAVRDVAEAIQRAARLAPNDDALVRALFHKAEHMDCDVRASPHPKEPAS
ncbi:MAG: Dimethylmenaquinone methyltransferase [Rhodoferax sp.]|nr:Dimethylmenaquinone methyltransferase [Rhodoferax sp.]